MNTLRSLAIVTSTVTVLLSATGIATPAPSVVDHRIQSVLYTPHHITHVDGWIGFHVQFIFEKGEEVTGVAGGDLEGLTYSNWQNYLFIKPRAPIVKTDISVVTNKRSYLLEYHVAPGRPDPEHDEVVYSVEFNYPRDPAVSNPDQVTEDLERAPAARYQNMDYGYCGSPLLRPVAAFDDGVHTTLRFAPSAEIPAIFVRGDDGVESLLNFTMEGRDVVIQRLAHRFILRRGKLVGCVTNNASNGAGERLETGTISPEVKRKTRGATQF